MSSNKNIENIFIENAKNLLQDFVKDIVDDNDLIKSYISKNKFIDIIKNIIILKNSQLEDKRNNLINNDKIVPNKKYNSSNMPLKNNTKRSDYIILDNKLKNVNESMKIYFNYREYISNLKKEKR